MKGNHKLNIYFRRVARGIVFWPARWRCTCRQEHLGLWSTSLEGMMAPGDWRMILTVQIYQYCTGRGVALLNCTRHCTVKIAAGSFLINRHSRFHILCMDIFFSSLFEKINIRRRATCNRKRGTTAVGKDSFQNKTPKCKAVELLTLKKADD